MPPGYADAANDKHKYPTLYMLDGQNAFDECTAFQGEHELQIDEAVTKLIGEHKIPAMIVVGVDSTEHRSYEYSPYKDVIGDPRAQFVKLGPDSLSYRAEAGIKPARVIRTSNGFYLGFLPVRKVPAYWRSVPLSCPAVVPFARDAFR